MTNYVWSVTDKSGEKVIREIGAATAEDAKFVLLAQGYTDLELKQDEIGSIAQAGFSKRQNAFGHEIKVTAEERMKHRDDPTATYFDALRKGIGRNSLFFGAFVFFILYSGFQRQWLYAALYAAVLLVWMAYILFRSLQSVYYRKLIKAADWNRWHEVIRLVAAIKMIGRFYQVKVPASELTRYRAKALAGLGRLDEALKEYKPCEGQPDCPDWLYKLFVGGLHDVVKQHDKAIEYNLASIELKSTSTAWIDLANRYARYQPDPVKARVALANAEKSPLSDIAKPFYFRCRGIIAYLEGDYSSARRDLEMAIDQVEKTRSAPFRDGRLSVTRGYLCCVLTRQGNLADAKRYFRLARKYLVATREDELLAEIRQLIGEK